MRDHPIAFGPFVLGPDSGTLSRNGERLAIGQRAGLLLEALASTPGRVRTKSELMDAAWPGLAIEESNLSVQIAALRKLLGPGPAGGEWIETIPRVGYRFVGERSTPSGEGHVPGRPGLVVPTLAVLPFVNLSDDPEQEYFADGVVEEIIAALSRFKSFAVIARNSSFVYKRRSLDVRQVADDLGVRYILEGSVRRAGARLRIVAQLVEASSGLQLWAQGFDGSVDDVFDFQDHITESVVSIVEPHIQIAEVRRLRRERPESLAAYDLYLQALPPLYEETEVGNRAAFSLLTRAQALEPDNATVLASMAWALSHRAVMGWPPFGPDDATRNIAFARRALDHAAGDAMVMASCSMTTLIHIAKDYDLGMAIMESAAAANPNSLIVVFSAGIVNLHCGTVEDALAYFHRAIRLSPRDPAAQYSLTGIAHAHMILGDYAEALAWAMRSSAVNANYPPTHWMLIAAATQLGRMEEARRLLAAFKQLVPDASVARIWAGQPQKDPSRLAAILDGLRKAGLEEG